MVMSSPFIAGMSLVRCFARALGAEPGSLSGILPVVAKVEYSWVAHKKSRVISHPAFYWPKRI
jgi:hypothetical protein